MDNSALASCGIEESQLGSFVACLHLETKESHFSAVATSRSRKAGDFLLLACCKSGNMASRSFISSKFIWAIGLDEYPALFIVFDSIQRAAGAICWLSFAPRLPAVLRFVKIMFVRSAEPFFLFSSVFGSVFGIVFGDACLRSVFVNRCTASVARVACFYRTPGAVCCTSLRDRSLVPLPRPGVSGQEKTKGNLVQPS